MILVPSLFTVKTILMIAFILKFETMSGKFQSPLRLVLLPFLIVLLTFQFSPSPFAILCKWGQDMSIPSCLSPNSKSVLQPSWKLDTGGFNFHNFSQLASLRHSSYQMSPWVNLIWSLVFKAFPSGQFWWQPSPAASCSPPSTCWRRSSSSWSTTRTRSRSHLGCNLCFRWPPLWISLICLIWNNQT